MFMLFQAIAHTLKPGIDVPPHLPACIVSAWSVPICTDHGIAQSRSCIPKPGPWYNPVELQVLGLDLIFLQVGVNWKGVVIAIEPM